MFGCLAVYVKDKIVLILRDTRHETADNGVWLATTPEHHDSLRREFPHMRSIQVFGTKVTSWQVLPADASDFEESRDARLRARARSRSAYRQGAVPTATRKGNEKAQRMTDRARSSGSASARSPATLHSLGECRR